MMYLIVKNSLPEYILNRQLYENVLFEQQV